MDIYIPHSLTSQPFSFT